jgi:hypothetical protein
VRTHEPEADDHKLSRVWIAGFLASRIEHRGSAQCVPLIFGHGAADIQWKVTKDLFQDHQFRFGNDASKINGPATGSLLMPFARRTANNSEVEAEAGHAFCGPFPHCCVGNTYEFRGGAHAVIALSPIKNEDLSSPHGAKIGGFFHELQG